MTIFKNNELMGMSMFLNNYFMLNKYDYIAERGYKFSLENEF